MKALDAARGLVRHPLFMARLAAYIEAQDGQSVAWWLRARLTREAQVRLTLGLLSREPITLQFDVGDVHWTAPTGDDIPAALLTEGGYSDQEVRAVSRWLRQYRPRSGRTVIDVGANIGTTTIPLVGEGWEVLAIEPVPSTFEYLEKNIVENGIGDRARAVQVAVACDQGVVVMAVSHSLGRSHVLGFGDTPPIGSYAEVEVEARPLGTIVSESGLGPNDVAWVWCDVEGSEPNVIASGAPLWANGVPLYAELGGDRYSPTLVEAQFSTFIAGQRFGALPRPIGELAGYLRTRDALDNVLLLP